MLNRSAGRRLARRETGRSWLPMLVADDGEAIVGSEDIEAWALAHPADVTLILEVAAGSSVGHWPP